MNPVCATAILGFSLWENALQLFYKVEGETLNLKQISCSFVLFFFSWNRDNWAVLS